MEKQRFPMFVRRGSVRVGIYCVQHKTAAAGHVFTLAWHSAGKRHTRQFTDFKDAHTEATLKADQLNAGRIEGASMSRSDRDELQAARRLAGETPLIAAMKEWSTARELTQGNVITAAEAWKARNSMARTAVTISQAVNSFMKAKEAAGVDIKCSYKKILPTLRDAFAERQLDSVSGRELQVWMHKRYPNPVTFNTARKRFVSLWRWCRKQGYLPRDAQTEAEQLDSAREETQKIGVINAETFRKLLEHIRTNHPEHLAALAIAGFCGLRRSEVHEQLWEDVFLERKFLRVTKAKRNTPSRRIVPLTDAAVEWLLLCKDRKEAVSLSFGVDHIRRLGREAKLTLPDNCFRHSFISHRVAQTGDVAATSLESGNSPAIIFRHYRELFEKQEGEAWFDIKPSGTSPKLFGMDGKAVASA